MILVWDFNGTLLDDVKIGIDSINVLLSRRGLPLIECREDYQRVFRFPIIDYYADLGLDVTEYGALAVEWVEEYLSREKDAMLVPGMRDILLEMKEKGIRQVLLSATEEGQLVRQVRELGLSDCFEAILGQGSIHAYSKVERARAYFEGEEERLLLIGDTDHDLEAAEAIGADCILCAHGHQSRERLASLSATVVSDAEELLALLRKETAS